MYVTLSIKASPTTFCHWNTICNYIDGSNIELIKVRFGFHQYAPTKPDSFYAEGIYGLHPLFFHKLRIDELKHIHISDPDFNEYVSTPNPTSRPPDHQPLIFYFFNVNIPINFHFSNELIKKTPFPSTSSIDKSKQPAFYWQERIEQIIKHCHDKRQDTPAFLWKHLITLYAYDWIVFFNENINPVLKELHPAHRTHWRNYRWTKHNFSFNMMMRAFYAEYLAGYPKSQYFYYVSHIPFQVFVHNQAVLCQQYPDRLLKKMYTIYSINEYGDSNEISDQL
jgi:hypothetical protein